MGLTSHLLVAVVVVVVVAAAAGVVEANNDDCHDSKCVQWCDTRKVEEAREWYQPQLCTKCCDNFDQYAPPARTSTMRLEELESKVEELRVMTGVLLALILLLILGALILVLSVAKRKVLRLNLPLWLKREEKKATAVSTTQQPTKGSNGVADPNATAVRLANHQNRSPVPRRASFRRSGHGPTEDTVTGPDTFRSFRVRQPSESTCPEEDSAQHGYDNLALSTSTIHNTSTSSTDTLGPTVSTNTLDTTLQSERSLHPNNSPV